MSEERRRAKRHPIGLRIEFDSGSGLSRDVSGLGVCFETEASGFHPGDEIEFRMFVPDAVNVDCRGTVVRVDPVGEGRHSVACTIDSFDLAEEPTESAASHLVIRELKAHRES